MPRRPSVFSLGLELEHVARAWLTAGALLAVYAWTMSRSVGFYDSPELALAAASLGLSHPIGQPLHTLVGHVFTLVVEPVFALNLLSAIAGALCVLPASALAERLVPRAKTSWFATFTFLAFGVHAALWDPATRIEVYSLATLCGLWAAARAAGTQPNPVRVGLALGLCASANALIAIIFAVPILFTALIGPSRWRSLSRLAVGGLVGLLPYAYVPFAAFGRNDAFVWGDPETWDTFVHYFAARDYVHNQGVSAPAFFSHVSTWVRWAWHAHVLVPWAVGSALGVHLALRARTPRALWLLVPVLTVAWVSSNVIFEPDILDYIDYLAPSLWLAAAGASAAVARLVEHGRGGRAMLVCLLFVSVAFLAPPSPGSRMRRDDRAAEVLARSGLAEVPRDGIVILESDHWVAPVLYAQEVQRVRTDVVVVAHGLASSSWYWALLYRRHPALKPFELRGPGGRDARLVRFLAAQPERAVVVQRSSLARAVGRQACAVGWLVHADGCERRVDAGAPSARMAALLERLGTGAPPTDSVLADIAADRGLALWQLGRGPEALRALHAGIPLERLPASVRALPRTVQSAPPLVTDLPHRPTHGALGDAGWNIVLAAKLLESAGRTDEARRYLNAAAP